MAGLACHRCGTATGCINSRPVPFVGAGVKLDATKRRRECPNCGYRFTTYEIDEMQLASILATPWRDMAEQIIDLIAGEYLDGTKHVKQQGKGNVGGRVSQTVDGSDPDAEGNR